MKCLCPRWRMACWGDPSVQVCQHVYFSAETQRSTNEECRPSDLRTRYAANLALLLLSRSGYHSIRRAAARRGDRIGRVGAVGGRGRG